ncbi:TPA: ATP-binding protein [Campylobacter fetus subsp. venerealis]|nr:ATP-binding protein [Campylobacter fetus subsp. venerealis]
MNNYTALKEVFVDDNGIFDYVNLDKSTITYDKILNALKEPLKLVLFYGKPGSGKTFLLHKIYKDISQKDKVIFFPQPFFNEADFINALSLEIFNQKIENPTYENLIANYKNSLKTDQHESKYIILLLDEAQLYPNFLIEKIRLMADTRLFKILFTVHKTDEEDTLAKDYFRTRIWENIELESSSLDEICLYIEKKLVFHNLHSYFDMYNINHIKLIYKLTNGNLRVLNKLLYKIYEIYEYYEESRPSTIKNRRLLKKVVEMAAIDSGLINA